MSGKRIFFSRVNFVCWLLFGVHFTPMLPQSHIKDPGHSAKSAYGRLHLNTHTPLTHLSWSGLTIPLSRQSGNLSGNKLTCNLSGNTWLQSSQLAEPPWTDPGLKSGISVRKLISTFKKRKKSCRQGMNCRSFSLNPCTQGKSHHHYELSVESTRVQVWFGSNVWRVFFAMLFSSMHFYISCCWERLKSLSYFHIADFRYLILIIKFCRNKMCQTQGRSSLRCQKMSGKTSTEPLHEDFRDLCSLCTGVSLACMTRKITWANIPQRKSTLWESEFTLL